MNPPTISAVKGQDAFDQPPRQPPGLLPPILGGPGVTNGTGSGGERAITRVQDGGCVSAPTRATNRVYTVNAALKRTGGGEE